MNRYSVILKEERILKGEIKRMNEKYETIDVEVRNKVAYVKFNRPQALNALNLVMLKELAHSFQTLSQSEEVSIVVLQGNGTAFSAGGDIKEMLQMAGEEQFSTVMDQINEFITTLYCMPKITIAAIEGPAAGLGFSFALAADFIICDQYSKLAMNFIGIGLVPDGGGHFLLQEKIGVHEAKKLIWEGKVLTAHEALELKLVDEVTANLQEKIANVIEKLQQKPVKAMVKTKEIYSKINQGKLKETLALEKQAQWEMRQTKDHQEGIKAFGEKRTPIFTGE